MASRNLTVALCVLAAVGAVLDVMYKDAQDEADIAVHHINTNPNSDAQWSRIELQRQNHAANSATELCMRRFGVTIEAATIRSEVREIESKRRSFGTVSDKEYDTMTHGEDCISYGEEARQDTLVRDWGARNDELSQRVINVSRKVFWKRFLSPVG